MKIEISQDEDGLYTVETESKIASRLMWHEMVSLVAKMSVLKESPECLVWLKDKDLFTEKEEK